MKATNRAAEFNTNFRELANLNLDKPQQEVKELRKLVLDTAWKKGFGADETSAAYNEIQSTIGLYGNEARDIVEKQGEFAKVIQANMGDYIAGTSKAMANWRFGNDRLDDFNKSAYATMQVGVVSFEQLSKVQSVYAGAAASVKQDFDTANKLFSLFTVRTKSVDEAATLTKSLFNDLTKKSTVDAFKKVGINFYDTNGQLKQADAIMLELNKKFMSMKNDRAIVALKNQFRGSEGLIAMIQAATDKSGQLKATFDEFTDSKMNFDNAASMAQQDILYRQEQLANRIDNLVIRMGQVLLPLKENIVGFAETAVEKLNTWIKSPDERIEQAAKIQNEIVQDKYGYLIAQAKSMSDADFNQLKSAFEADIKKYNNSYDTKSQSYANADFWQTPLLSHFLGYEDKMQRLDDRNNYDRHFDKAAANARKNLLSDLITARNGDLDSSASNTASGNSKDLSGLESSLTRVTGAAQAPRNLYVTIGSLISGGINTQNTKLQNMDVDQIENTLVDLCMRVVHNVETSYN